MTSSPQIEETIHDSDPQLRHARRFFSRAASDLGIAGRLAASLLRFNLRARYRQSMLGYVWLLATPLSIAAVWIFLHKSQLVSFGTFSVPYPVYVTTGILFWTAFLRMLNSPLQQLQNSRPIMSKIGFPWEALLLAGWGEALVEAGAYMVVIIGVYLAFSMPIASIVIAIPSILALLILGAALGSMLAPFGLLYEDVPRAVGVAAYLLFFLTPIVYAVPVGKPGVLVLLANPVAILLVSAREIMMGQTVMHPTAALLAGLGSVLLFILSWITFRLSIPHLVSKL